MHNPALVRTLDTRTRVRRSAAGVHRIDREEEVVLGTTSASAMALEARSEVAYHTAPVVHRIRIAARSAAQVLDDQVDADSSIRLAVVVASVVRLHRPELHAVAGPAAEVIEDWTEVQSATVQQSGVGIRLRTHRARRCRSRNGHYMKSSRRPMDRPQLLDELRGATSEVSGERWNREQ